MTDTPADPERALSLAYAPAGARPALSALWRLDEQLGSIVARTENPAVGQMQLTWWHEALRELDTKPQVDPILIAIAGAPGLDPKTLLPLIDGWEVFLEPLPLRDEALTQFAQDRGATLFRAAGHLLGSDAAGLESAGRLWALVDLAFRVTDAMTAKRAQALALASHVAGPLPRPLAILTALARSDARKGPHARRQGSPMRLARALVAGLTGR